MLAPLSNRPRPRFHLLVFVLGIVMMLGGFGFAGLFGVGSLISYANDGPVSAMVIGLAVLAAGVCVTGIVIINRQVKRIGPQQIPTSSHPGQPWLLRDDWEQNYARDARGGTAVFHFRSTPGVLGGRLQGRIEWPAPAAGPHRLTLTGSKHSRSGRGSPDLIWCDETPVTLRPDAGGASADVDFEIPFDAPPTSNSPTGEITWDVGIMAGDDYVAGFYVPVFRTEASNPGRTREVLESEAGARLLGSSFVPSRIQRVPTAMGASYRTHAGRERKSAWSALAVALFFGGMATVLGQASDTPRFVVAILGVVGLLALWSGIWLMFGQVSVETSMSGLRVRSSCLVYSRTREVPVGEIERFEIEYGGSAGFRLHVWANGDRRVTCATGLEKPEALWLAACLRRDLPAQASPRVVSPEGRAG